MNVKALYPGTFDPPTNGHLDLITRGCKLFNHLTVAILVNPVKNPLFTVEERVEMHLRLRVRIPNGADESAPCS
jgi:pantetheine-phosphate adenylyltransferase